MGADPVLDARARACAEQAVERVELSVELSADDMERVVAAMADMFALGWHASADRPGRALVDRMPRRASVCFGSAEPAAAPAEPALGRGRKGGRR